jgi:hypothetical protein
MLGDAAIEERFLASLGMTAGPGASGHNDGCAEAAGKKNEEKVKTKTQV